MELKLIGHPTAAYEHSTYFVFAHGLYDLPTPYCAEGEALATIRLRHENGERPVRLPKSV
jgi:hypothetical protein